MRSADASDAQRAAKRQKRVDGRKQPRAWEESRALLEEYRDAHGGDCNVPDRWKDDPRLGKWVTEQKAQWRKYKADPATSSMSAERVAALRQMGAIDSWQEASLRAGWMNNVGMLCARVTTRYALRGVRTSLRVRARGL